MSFNVGDKITASADTQTYKTPDFSGDWATKYASGIPVGTIASVVSTPGVFGAGTWYKMNTGEFINDSSDFEVSTPSSTTQSNTNSKPNSNNTMAKDTTKKADDKGAAGKEAAKKSPVGTIIMIAAAGLLLYAGYKWYTGKKS